jgi:hypothetical protein
LWFANRLQMQGLSKREAGESRAPAADPDDHGGYRAGVVPLLTATARARSAHYDIGLVIATGMSVPTLFTIFVVLRYPAGDHRRCHTAISAGTAPGSCYALPYPIASISFVLPRRYSLLADFIALGILVLPRQWDEFIHHTPRSPDDADETGRVR